MRDVQSIGGNRRRLVGPICEHVFVRWDAQRTDAEDGRLPGIGTGGIVRTFDAPEAMGINFHEVEAKSVLNHVPGDRYGFSWTINAFRGCTHACSYCLRGDTPILMADGRSKPLGDLKVGDEIYGTRRGGTYRHYTRTKVLAHWATRKRAYKIVLEDGTELVASGDHRFLSNRGWKFVTGTEQGAGRRPHLTLANKLMGFGAIEAPLIESTEYRLGYLTGMIRGDGHVGSYSYEPRPGRTTEDHHRFRLALTDLEALDRSERYLAFFGVPTKRFAFHRATATQRSMDAIRTSSREGVEGIRRLIEWPRSPTPEWTRGFAAGIFDAEGSCIGALRVANKDPEILTRTTEAFRELGLSTTLEPPVPNGCRCVRLLGGLKQQLRFFSQANPAISRKKDLEGIALKSKAALGIVEIEPLPGELELFDITTGTGDFIANGVVSHNCFARPTHTYLGFDAGRDFEREIVVKVNAPEVVRRELMRPSWKRELVAIGTNTDPYQWVEGRYRFMPEILAALEDSGTPVTVLTKSPLALRDIDIYERMAKKVDVSVSFSVPTLDEKVWRQTEPHTPNPRARLEAVAELKRRGIRSGVLIAPLMPGINDAPEQIRPIEELAREAGADFATGIALHLRKGVRDVFMGWLQVKRPDLVPEYERMFEGNRAYMKAEDRKRATANLKGWGRSLSRRGLRPRREAVAAKEKMKPASDPQASLF